MGEGTRASSTRKGGKGGKGVRGFSHLFPEAAAAAAAAVSATILTAGGLRPGPWGARERTGPGQGPKGHCGCADRLNGGAGA